MQLETNSSTTSKCFITLANLHDEKLDIQQENFKFG